MTTIEILQPLIQTLIVLTKTGNLFEAQGLDISPGEPTDQPKTFADLHYSALSTLITAIEFTLDEDMSENTAEFVDAKLFSLIETAIQEDSPITPDLSEKIAKQLQPFYRTLSKK